MNQNKANLEKLFENGDLESARIALNQYEKDYPNDLDSLMMETNYYVLTGNNTEAYKFALEAYKRMPLSGDVNYNLACVMEYCGDYFNAYMFYNRAMALYEYTHDTKLDNLHLSTRCSDALHLLEQEILKGNNPQQGLNELENLMRYSRSTFGLVEQVFRRFTSIIGQYYQTAFEPKRYVGNLDDKFAIGQSWNFLKEKEIEQREDYNLIWRRGEFLTVEEGQQFVVKQKDKTDYYYLPIAVSEPSTIHHFSSDLNKTIVAQMQSMHFSYYKVKGNTQVSSTSLSYYGHPIPIKSDPEKKKLVLNVFLDGLSSVILKGEGFQETMPYLYGYFKDGLIFDNAYSAAEWTYPSLANCVLGLATSKHMMFHNELDQVMPHEYPTIAETFQKEGYYTTFIGGDWRITPNYGHDRGYDRFIYQNAKAGFRAEEIVSHAIDHIEAFKELNQFVWLSIGDLHDIADLDDLALDVLTNLELKYREVNTDETTSVKTVYDENKVEQYIHQAKHLDLWMHILLEYIKENYAEDEVVVSVFADHGQGYLLPPSSHFMDSERTNIAYMFQGGEAIGKGRTDEIVSLLDYGHIIRKLSGVPEPAVQTDGVLPRILGGEGREFALAESLHPNDPYYAAIYTGNRKFFFTNPSPVITEGRFELADYGFRGESSDGSEVDDEEKQKYLDIVLEHIAHLILY